MSLITKCILTEVSKDDDLRISVMSRHTLNDGVTPDLRILPHLYDLHWTVLAPNPKLIGDYYRRNLQWQDFRTRFLEQIQLPEPTEYLRRLAELSLRINVTLLCIEETPEYCHRGIISDECLRIEPRVRILHL
jgi:uncharacterized protein YeaO (DUF488 family)